MVGRWAAGVYRYMSIGIGSIRSIFKVSVSSDLLPILPLPKINLPGRVLLDASYFVKQKFDVLWC